MCIFRKVLLSWGGIKITNVWYTKNYQKLTIKVKRHFTKTIACYMLLSILDYNISSEVSLTMLINHWLTLRLKIPGLQASASIIRWGNFPYKVFNLATTFPKCSLFLVGFRCWISEKTKLYVILYELLFINSCLIFKTKNAV